MERNVASVLALAGTAAITVTLAAVAPGDAYASFEGVKGPLAQGSASPGFDKAAARDGNVHCPAATLLASSR